MKIDKASQKGYWEANKNQRPYDHPIVRFFAKQRIGYLKRYLDFRKIGSAFDVGCGDGFSTYYMGQEIKKVEGGDISEHMLDNNPVDRKKLRVIDAEKLDLPDDSYDLVYTWEVLHHLPHPEKAVAEMARVAKRHVVIYEPNRANVLQILWGLSQPQERGTLRSSKKYLTGLCRQAGLTVVRADYCGRILPNMTPRFAFRFLKHLPFKAGRFTGISIAVIAEKPSVQS
ncbi:MAG: class I SAM-dependent methyltransferase [bacterium]|nr:class I SAM-dependent methyltransferase [bacterium]MDZ4248208.1 class I SAM-dependent methyltransferase [Patescibacteria group bacterium]